MDSNAKKDSKKQDSAKTIAKKVKIQQKETVVQAAKDEIDELFNTAKKSKKEKSDSTEEISDAKKKKKARTQAVVSQVRSDEDASTYGLLTCNQAASSIISPEAPIHRFDTESGLPVYKAHLLKVGEGGGTPLCPFDCDCCF